jgi:gliding motility-associated-like protein
MGERLTLNVARAGLKYRWQDGTQEAGYIVTAPGLYWVELSNTVCKITDSIRVTYDTSLVELGQDTVLCLGEQLRLTAPYAGLDYRWSTSSTDAAIFIEQAGVYWLEYKQPESNCWKRDSVQVSFQECFHDLLIPNIITPNGDQFNETFQPGGAKGTTWDLILYNRWGRQIERYENYQNDWKAQGLDNGIYYYILISRISGRSFKGWVQVLR